MPVVDECPGFARLSLRIQARLQAARCHLGALRKATLQLGGPGDGIPLRDTAQLLEEEVADGLRELGGLTEQLGALGDLTPGQAAERARLVSEYKAALADYHKLTRKGHYPPIPDQSSRKGQYPAIPDRPTSSATVTADNLYPCVDMAGITGNIHPASWGPAAGDVLPSGGTGELEGIASIHGAPSTSTGPPTRAPPAVPPTVPPVPVITLQGADSPEAHPVPQNRLSRSPTSESPMGLPGPTPGSPGLPPGSPGVSRRENKRRRRRHSSRNLSPQRDLDHLSTLSVSSETTSLLPGSPSLFLPAPPSLRPPDALSVNSADSVLVLDSVQKERDRERRASLRVFCGLICAAVIASLALGWGILFYVGKYQT